MGLFLRLLEYAAALKGSLSEGAFGIQLKNFTRQM